MEYTSHEGVVDLFDLSSKMIETTSKLDLKPVPSHLKHIFLGENETKPIIIYAHLNEKYEGKLVALLRQFKIVTGWGLTDIQGISLSTCMHKIVLNDGAELVGDRQQRLKS